MSKKSYQYDYRALDSFLELSHPEEVSETLDEAMYSLIAWAGETERPSSSLPEDYRILRSLRNIFREMQDNRGEE